MGHFTGSDMNVLNLQAFQAYSRGDRESACRLGEQVLQAYRSYYGSSHTLTKTAEENLKLFQSGK